MSEEKRNESTEENKGTAEGSSDKSRGSNASRARNQTVMLSPELTGQVRAMMGKAESSGGNPDPLSELLPPMGWDRPAGGSSASNPRVTSGDYGSDLPNEADLSADIKRPTGKMRSGSSPSVGASSTGQPAFSVNPSISRGGAAPRSQSHLTSIARNPNADKAVKTKIIGFFVSFDNNSFGEVFEIHVGRWLLTSRVTDQGDNIVIEDESISPLHAIVRATNEGKVQVLDQLSEFGTGVTRTGSSDEEEVAGAMVTLNHGDSIRFGKRHFVVCLIPRGAKEVGQAG